MVNNWNRGDGTDVSAAKTVSSSIESAVSKRTRLTHGMFQDLAHELHSTLAQAQSALGAGSTLSEAELKAGLNEMPRLDLDSVAVDYRPAFRLPLGKALAKRRVAGALSKRIGPDVERTLRGYASVFEAWARNALEAMRLRFDSHADACRAQFQRLRGDGRAAEDELHIRKGLDALLTAGSTRSPNRALLPDEEEQRIPG
jgi:hypothetical protein